MFLIHRRLGWGPRIPSGSPVVLMVLMLLAQRHTLEPQSKAAAAAELCGDGDSLSARPVGATRHRSPRT